MLYPNIDSMLQKNNIVGAVEKINLNEDKPAIVNRIQKGKDKSQKKKNQSKNPYCPECFYLSKKLSLDVNYDHFPNDCPRPKSAVNLLLADVGVENVNNSILIMKAIYF